MTQYDLPVTEDELHAHVDGELSADRIPAVQAWLTTHPADAERVAAWRAQADDIRARYGAVANEDVPRRLSLDRIAASKRSWAAMAAAAAAVAFLVGGGAGWMARGASAAAPSAFDIITTEAVDAYKLYVVEVRHPVEVPGEERTHLVQWLSKRMGRELRLPDLNGIGLKLVGGRLLPGSAGAAAFFMYENAAGERFTLYYARSGAPETAMLYQAADQAGAMYWVDRNIAYVLSGPADRSALSRIAKAAYEQIDTPSGTNGKS